MNPLGPVKNTLEMGEAPGSFWCVLVALNSLLKKSPIKAYLNPSEGQRASAKPPYIGFTLEVERD